MRIVLAGGGSGGHIFPLQAVVREIKKQHEEKENLSFLYLGPDGEMEKRVMEAEAIPTKKILCAKLRRYFSARIFLEIFYFPLGIFQCLVHLLAYMPDAVFVKGGYASVPVAIAAWVYRIPILIHESDAAPGLANQIMSRIATRIAISFPGSEQFFPERKVFLSGNPIRNEILEGSRAEAQKIFSLSPDKKTILVIGGSQGAAVINRSVVNLLPKLLPLAEVIHLTGPAGFDNVVREAGKIGVKAGHGGYFVYAFLSEELPHAFAAADLIISRAGANTLTEIAACGKPSIIIPIAGSANSHQEQNAFIFSQGGAAVILEQANLGENILLEKIKQILEDKELNLQLTNRVKKFYNPQAAAIIAKEVIGLAK